MQTVKRTGRRRCLKSATATVAAVVVAGSLGACGASPGGAAGGNTITATYMKAGTYDAAAQSIKSSFEKSSGVKVNVFAFPFAVLEQKNQTDLATQTGDYDVLSTSAWDVAMYRYLQPTGNRMAQTGLNKEIIPALQKSGPTPYFNGKPVGVPYAVDAYGVMYRTDLIHGTPHWSTWDQLLAYAKSLKNKLPQGVAPIAFAFGAPEQTPAIFQGAYDGPWIRNGKWQLDRARARHALQITQAITKLGPPNATALSIDEANAAFLQGKAAILIGWPSFVRGALNDPKQSKIGSNWAQTPFPGPGSVMMSNWDLSVSKLSKNQDADWKWIKAYVNPANAKKWMFKYGMGSPFKSTYTDPRLLKQHANDLPIQRQNLDRAKPTPLTFQAFESMYRSLGDMVAGKLTPDQTITAWEKAWSQEAVPAPLVDIARSEGFVAP